MSNGLGMKSHKRFADAADPLCRWWRERVCEEMFKRSKPTSRMRLTSDEKCDETFLKPHANNFKKPRLDILSEYN